MQSIYIDISVEKLSVVVWVESEPVSRSLVTKPLAPSNLRVLV